MKQACGKKVSHPSAGWTVEQKREQLIMVRLVTPPHFSVFTRTHERLPTLAYLIPQDIDYGALSPEIAQWIKESGFPIPALRFQVKASVTDDGYNLIEKPQICIGILRRRAVKDWAQVPNIQQLWFPPVWAATGFPLQKVAETLFQQAQGKPINREFAFPRALDQVLTEQQKIFIAIVSLHAAWTHLEIPKSECAKHIVQLGLKKELAPNNFANYAVEAGWGEMGDSQVERLWAKLLTAQRRAERFVEELRAKRQKDLDRFKKVNCTNPFLFNVLEEFRDA